MADEGNTLTVARKVIASAVNCSITFLVTAPFLKTPNYWALIVVGVFFSLQQLGRCPGMLATRQYWQTKRPSLLYSLLYTTSFSTLLWYIFFPLDVALINGILQWGCIRKTGHTIQGLITGTKIMWKNEDVLDALMRGCCPDCKAEATMRCTDFQGDFKCSACGALYDCNTGFPYKLKQEALNETSAPAGVAP